MKVTIYGERCSGTNYLEQLLLLNFDVEIIWDYGWKHFFGHSDLTNTDDIVFIGIVRNLYDWINSFYKEKHQLPMHLHNRDSFLSSEFYSIDEVGKEIMEDRHIKTKDRYKDIFELRHVKNSFLVDTMPTLVKNYCLITHDNLLNHFNITMNKLKMYLPIKTKIPMNIKFYKNEKNKIYVKSNIIFFDKNNILNRANLHYEKILFT